MEEYQLSEYNDSQESNKVYVELVDVNKFAVLFVCSLGLYGIWWMYKVWNFFKIKENLDIIPVARAIFALFFTFQLFEKILDFAKKEGYQSSYNSVLLFIGFLLANFTSKLPDPYGLVAIFAFIFLFPPIRAFNYGVMNSPQYDGEEVQEYNSRQLFIVFAGIMFWGLIIFGLTMGVPMDQ